MEWLVFSFSSGGCQKNFCANANSDHSSAVALRTMMLTVVSEFLFGSGFGQNTFALICK